MYSIIFQNNYGDGIRIGPMFCPKIDTALTGNVYIHNGTSQEVVVKGNFFPEVRVNIINIYKCLTSTVLIHAKTNFNKIDHCYM